MSPLVLRNNLVRPSSLPTLVGASGLFIALAALILAGCKKPDESSSSAAKTNETTADTTAAGGSEPHAGEPRPDTPAAEAPAIATLCTLAGPPMQAASCRDLMHSIAVTSEHVYLAHGEEEFRRYLRPETGSESCALALDTSYGEGGLAKPPVVEPPPQKLEGSVQLRSGGPEWRFVASGETVHAYDFLGGVVRLTGTSGPESCPQLTGIFSMASLGGSFFAKRGEIIERIADDCTTLRVNLEPAFSHVQGLSSAAGELLVAGKIEGKSTKQVVAFDSELAPISSPLGAEKTFDDGGICSLSGAVRCASQVCVVDNNCKDIDRFGTDGAISPKLEFGAVFSEPVDWIGDVVAHDGEIWIGAPGKSGGECAAQLYRVAGDRLAPGSP